MDRALPHRWSVNHNYLAGITAGHWWRLLRENRFAVSPLYWHRAAFVTLASLMNSYYARRERRTYEEQIERVRISQPPLFILGHWRSGTTLLHYLLAQDTSQFTFANTFQVVNPRTFLTTEKVMTRRFAKLVPAKRPMDNMSQSFSTPQEDEFAPLLMSLYSLYLGITFPARADYYSRFLTFRDASSKEIEEWKQSFLWFCKKVTLKNDRPILLKSPAHTGRIRLILEMFPDARFVHIHRDPYRVFQSQRHFFNTAAWYTYLQKPDVTTIDDGILQRYRTMYDAYFDEVKIIPPEQFCEVRFSDLERDPYEATAGIYRSLSLSGFDRMKAKLRDYVGSLAGYRKNEFQELNPASRRQVATRWERNFQAWDYPI